MRQVGEPSVEEILESIKQVIARDNRSDAAEVRREREKRGVSAPAAAQADDGVLELGAEAVLIEEAAAAAEAESPLLNQDAASSMRESLAALAMLAEPSARPQIVRSGATSLDGLARDLLRPALA